MKRILIMLSLILSIIGIISVVGYAEDIPAEDAITSRMNEHCSFYIEPEILDTLGELEVDPTARILKVYNTSLTFFYDKSTMDEFFDSDYSDTQFYVILFNTGEMKFYGKIMGYKSPEGSMFNRDLPFTYFNDDPIKKLSPDITVYNMYYLSCATNHQSSVLWYETDMGEYVYYSGAGGLLMPSDIFVDYIRQWLETKVGNGYGGTGKEVDFDISPYAINSPDFDPSVLVGTVNTGNQPVGNDPGKPDNTPWIVAASGAAVAVAAVSAVLILRKRKAHTA